jgi:flavin-dependent dehydrogenase
MAKAAPQPDVLVLGNHPCAYFAAALLRHQAASLRVLHATIPGEQFIDRVVVINPELFGLHAILSALKRRLDLAPVYGLKFLSDDPQVSTTHVGRTIGAYVGSFAQVHSGMVKLATDAGVPLRTAKSIEIQHLDETGLDVAIDEQRVHAKLLLLAGELPALQRQMLGLPDAGDGPSLHRYTFLRLKGGKWHDSGGSKPVVPMSLDLNGTLNWGWLLPGPGQIQIAVAQSLDTIARNPPAGLLEHWIDVLSQHGELRDRQGIDFAAAQSLDLPLGGALAQEGVANRTLLIGPAGGFYTACAEDIYPNCWSAVFAADVAKKALKEPHLQDALQPYRQRWGSTLGDYLRGPQQNLRFLLPLVYRNAIMTGRLTEAILSGKSVVR